VHGSEGTSDGLAVTICDTDEALAAASGIFNDYRHHYGEPPSEDARALGWLTDMVGSKKLTVYTAAPADGPPVGFATSHEVPASLTMGRFWQLRDLYVLPEGRRLGVGRALVLAVCAAAREAGAARLSLVTEPDNDGALGLYQALGFEHVEGLVTLSLSFVRPP
jgi:ribosomal protein S18 acetylase RimI-like enzyme